jgi:hypothetical protein
MLLYCFMLFITFGIYIFIFIFIFVHSIQLHGAIAHRI